MLWEILVPTVKPNTNGEKFFTVRFHRVWDKKVLEISNGLTIMSPSKGQWISPHGATFKERMIPVRLMASRDEIKKIAKFTAEYYGQEAVMVYKISDEVILHFNESVKNVN